MTTVMLRVAGEGTWVTTDGRFGVEPSTEDGHRRWTITDLSGLGSFTRHGFTQIDCHCDTLDEARRAIIAVLEAEAASG